MSHTHFHKIDFDELIRAISFHPRERLHIFLEKAPEVQALVLFRLTKRVQHDVVNRLSDNDLILLLEQLDPNKATDVVQLLTKQRQKVIIPILHEDLKKSIELLAQFDPKTAAGLMNVDYIQVEESDTMAEVAKQFKAHEQRTGRLPVMIVMHQGRVTGYLPGHELGFSKPDEIIKKFVRHIYTIKHDASHDEVVRIFREHPHNKIAVLGEQGNMLGIIYSDDILRVLEEQQSASLYDFAGVSKEESVTDPTRTKVKNRYQWLIINLGTAFLAAFTVGQFDEMISKYVLLAVYMPIVAGMGGNAATQTLAVMVRGIALKQIDLKTAGKTLWRELGSGCINGIINGILVAAVVLVVNRDVKIAFILAMAMVVNLLVAGFFGTLVPLIMKRFGKDPATSATIFITTATDVLGFLAFLGLATLVLS